MDFSATITRAKFEEINNDLFKKTLAPVAQVLKDVGVTKAQVSHFVAASLGCSLARLPD